VKRIRSLLVLASSCAIVVGCGGGASDPSSTPDNPEPNAIVALPESAQAQMKALIEEKNARTPAQKKIASQLLYAKAGTFNARQKAGRQKGGDDEAPAARNRLLRFDDQGRVLVDVRGDLGGGLVREIENLNGTVVTTSAAYNSARAWMPMGNLEALAALVYVRGVRPALTAQTNRANPTGMPQVKISTGRSFPARADLVKAQLEHALASTDDAATNVGARQSQGDRAHKADRARKFFNTDGTGVRVGVLSDSARFLANSIASGDIRPDAVVIPGARSSRTSRPARSCSSQRRLTVRRASRTTSAACASSSTATSSSTTSSTSPSRPTRTTSSRRQ